ncbi:MAG: hypothetical protein WD035_07555 [Balneolaceae bacterium]
MNVLIPYDINTTGLRNPYLFQLLKGLEFHSGIAKVQHGYGWLHVEEGSWDVIHLHWPEELMGAGLPDSFSETELREESIQRLTNLLESWKAKGTTLVLTVHNELPHKQRNEKSVELYRQIYSLVDVFIHMGEESVKLISEKFPEETAGKPTIVIPHGDYSLFPNLIGKREARKRLGISLQKNVMLAFGAIRSEEELNMGINAMKSAGMADMLYLIAGKIPYPYKSKMRHFTVRRKLFFNKGRVKTEERVIPPEEVQIYMNAADLLFIPRIRALNSGNVALGFNFGKVVAGPDYGVIGEVLGQTGNPVFDPSDLSSVASAIREGFRLSGTDLGQQNRDYCRRYMNWKKIADQYVNVYAGRMDK